MPDWITLEGIVAATVLVVGAIGWGVRLEMLSSANRERHRDNKAVLENRHVEITELRERIVKLETNGTGIVRDLKSVEDRLTKAIDTNSEHMEKGLEKLERHFESALDRINNSISNLHGRVNEELRN